MAKKERQWVTKADVLDLTKPEQKAFFQGVDQEQAPAFKDAMVYVLILVGVAAVPILILIASAGN